MITFNHCIFNKIINRLSKNFILLIIKFINLKKEIIKLKIFLL